MYNHDKPNKTCNCTLNLKSQACLIEGMDRERMILKAPDECLRKVYGEHGEVKGCSQILDTILGIYC